MADLSATSIIKSLEKLQSQIDELCEICEVEHFYNALQKVRRLVNDEKLRGRITKAQKKTKAAKLAQAELAT